MNASATDWLPPGYAPVRPLGKGGMGEVWLAARPGGELRAVKRMKLSAESGVDRLRFKREFRVLARLTHPGIVRVFDFHESADDLAYAMEFVEGWRLQEYFAGGHWPGGAAPARLPRPLPAAALARLWEVAAELLETLEALHAEGIVHRDLKPSNILLGHDHRVRLIDFGLARSETEQDLGVTSAGEVVGTPLYLSPEQIRARPLDGRSDLYALGVMLYELAAGRHPFDEGGVAAVLVAHLQQPVIPPASHNPAITPGYNAFILRLLAKEPGARPSGARAARETLRQLGAGGDGMLDATLAIPADAFPPLGGLLQSPLIGNDALVEKLRAAASELAAGRGGVRLITGEAGAGKSRLLDEVRVQALDRQLRTWRGAGRAAGGSLGQLFQDFFAMAAQDIAARPKRLEWLGHEGPLLAHYFPALRVHVGAAQHLPGDAAAEEARLMVAVYEFFDRLLKTEKILLLADDLHHADPLSVRLLAHLAMSFTGTGAAAPDARPLLIVAGLRETELAGPARELVRSLTSRSQPLRLAALGAPDTGRLAQASLGLAEPPAAPLAGRLHEITGGNPFFILELLRQGLDEGTLGRAGGRLDLERWLSLTHSGAIKLPGTLEEAVRARLHGLAEADRAALQLAAIIGSQFHFGWWSALAETGEDPLLDIADRAIRAGLLEETGPDVLRFAHGLTRIELEREVSGLKRRRLHKKIVAILAAAGPQQRLALAEHAIDSGDPGLTAEHAVPVVSALRDEGQFIEARRLLQRLVQVHGEDPPLTGEPRVRFWQHRGAVERFTGKLPVAVDHCRRAVALADAGGDPALRFECLHGLLHILLFSGRYAEVEAGLPALLALGEALGDAKRRGTAIMLGGSLLTAKGDWRGALERYEKVLALCQGEEHWVLRSNALNFSARAWEIGMDTAKSREFGEAAFELVWRHGNLNRIAVYQANLAEGDWFEGNLESARRRGESAIEAGRKSGDQHALNWALAMDAQVYTDLGDNATARRRFEGALAIAEETTHPIDAALARQAQGQLYLAGGVDTPGDEALEAAARVFGDADFLLVSLATAAQASLRGGERARAEALAREILSDNRGINPGAQSLARALLAGLAGDDAGIAGAIAAADSTGRVPVGFAVRLTAAEALLLTGRNSAALKVLDELEPRARERNFQGTLKQIALLRQKPGKTAVD